MKRIINTLLIAVSPVLLFSCEVQDPYDMPINEAIVLDLSSGVTKATVMEDSRTESFVNHIDVLIFTDNAGSPDLKMHYERCVVNNESQLVLSAGRSSFDVNALYHVYLVANSNLPESDFVSVGSYADFVGKKQTDEQLHLTGLAGVDVAPEYFLMDAKAADAPVVLYDGNPADNTVLSAVLRRAAAKVVIRIKAGEDVTFADFGQSEDGSLLSDGGQYYIRNLPYQAFLLAEARAEDSIDANVVDVRNTDPSSDGHFTWNPETDNRNATLVTYVYPYSWTTDIVRNETCAVVNLPLVYSPEGQEPEECHNSWYKIQMTGDKLFKRNNYYEVNVEINRPGAVSETVPVELDEICYAVEEWTSQTINVGGDDKPRYLSVNREEMEMYNVAVDSRTLEFASSSPVTITVEDIYYYNKFGQKTEVSPQISGTTDGGIAGNITVSSPVPTNNAIRYFTLVVANQDGLVERVSVAQYPLEYITNQQGWYSYRSDFRTGSFEPTTYEYKGSGTVAANWGSGQWSYSTSAQQSYFFGSKVSRMNANGTSQLYYYYWSQNGNNVNTDRGNLTSLNNARMYHVQIMASSGKYIIGIPKLDDEGFTDAGDDNSKLVSPSFMIASQLGATQSPNSLEQARRHCREYVEVHDPDGDPDTDNAVHYDNWRLPTAAEIKIIIDFQYVENAAMDEVLSGPSYWSATGTVQNPQSTGVNMSSAVRCIRDVY